jgi:hypothetical protein
LDRRLISLRFVAQYKCFSPRGIATPNDPGGRDVGPHAPQYRPEVEMAEFDVAARSIWAARHGWSGLDWPAGCAHCPADDGFL